MGRRGGRWARLLGVMGLVAALAACAGGGTVAPPPLRTATPLPSPTPRATATPRPLAVLEPTATALPGSPTPRTQPTATGAASASPVAATATVSPARSVVFSADNAYRHLEELSIGVGVRAAGTPGEAKGADYVADQLASLGYSISRQPFSITTFQDNGSTLTLPDAEPRQLQPLALYYSGSGQVEGALVLAGLGAPADFLGGVAQGKIALIERGGGLTFQEKARHARAGGAVAVVVFNNIDGVMQGALADPFDLPVVSISRADGLRLRRLVEQRVSQRAILRVNVTTELKPSVNVVAVAPGLRPNLPIVVVGGHHDTVPAGPGANDNGSGLGVLIEMARVLAREQRAEVRFVAFGSEEIGLLGSRAYVEALTAEEKARIVAMINVDMIGVGPALSVAGSDDLVTQAIATAERLSIARVTRLAANSRSAASDHVSFISAGIPALFIHRPDDPNYHTAQDRAQFVRTDALLSAGTLALAMVEQAVARRV